jgi:hypothetical protein
MTTLSLLRVSFLSVKYEVKKLWVWNLHHYVVTWVTNDSYTAKKRFPLHEFRGMKVKLLFKITGEIRTWFRHKRFRIQMRFLCKSEWINMLYYRHIHRRIFVAICIQNIFECELSSDSGVDLHVILRNILDSVLNTGWEPKFSYRISRWTHRDFSSVMLATQSMTQLQRCFRQSGVGYCEKVMDVKRKMKLLFTKYLEQKWNCPCA